MFRLQSVAIFMVYQYLKAHTASLYSLPTVNGKMYNANMLLKHKCMMLYQNNIQIIKTQDSY
jgi:hypothetical protein